jgi:hypothetical protein
VAVIAAELLRATFVSIESARAARSFTSPVVEFHALFDLDAGALLAGLVLLVVAEAFRHGADLKDEQDLTI